MLDEFISNLKIKYRLNELEKCVRGIEIDIENALKVKPVIKRPDNCNYLLDSLGKSLVTAREIIVLCYNGLPDGALALARNLCEQFAITAYIESKKEDPEFEKMLLMYFDDYEVKKLKQLRDRYPKQQERINQELTKIKQKYGITSLKDCWWAGNKTFRDILNETRRIPGIQALVDNVSDLYSEACNTLHASFLGNISRSGSNSSAIELGPWENGQEKSLYVCVVSLICTVSYTYDELHIDKAKDEMINNKLNELGCYYRSILKEQAGL